MILFYLCPLLSSKFSSLVFFGMIFYKIMLKNSQNVIFFSIVKLSINSLLFFISFYVHFPSRSFLGQKRSGKRVSDSYKDQRNWPLSMLANVQETTTYSSLLGRHDSDIQRKGRTRVIKLSLVIGNLLQGKSMSPEKIQDFE